MHILTYDLLLSFSYIVPQDFSAIQECKIFIWKIRGCSLHNSINIHSINDYNNILVNYQRGLKMTFAKLRSNQSMIN